MMWTMTATTMDQTAGPDQAAPRARRWSAWRARRAARRSQRDQTTAQPRQTTPMDHPLGQAAPTIAEWSRRTDERALGLAAEAIADRVDQGQLTIRLGRLVRGRSRPAAVDRSSEDRSRGRLALAVPLVGVNASALIGQVGWAMDHLGQAAWLDAIPYGQALRAVAFAATLESIGVYLSYEAHAALLARVASLKLRLGAYGVGAIVGAMNYSHYAPQWDPTAPAIGYGLLSLASPILWTVWSMARSRRKLIADGNVDARSARFSAAKKSLFPLRTLLAMRHAVDHGITDERPAWEAYRQHREQRRADRALRRADRDHANQTRERRRGRVRGWLVRRRSGKAAVVQDQAPPALEMDQDQAPAETPADQPPALPAAPARTKRTKPRRATGGTVLDHAGRVAALLDRYPGLIPSRRQVQADMRPTGPGWSNSQQVQDAINEARRRRAAA